MFLLNFIYYYYTRYIYYYRLLENNLNYYIYISRIRTIGKNYIFKVE